MAQLGGPLMLEPDSTPFWVAVQAGALTCHVPLSRDRAGRGDRGGHVERAGQTELSGRSRRLAGHRRLQVADAGPFSVSAIASCSASTSRRIARAWW